MLISLLVELGQAMKDEGIELGPEHLSQAARYVFLSNNLFPDNDLKESLKPILISRFEETAAYYKAWERIRNSKNQKLSFHQLLGGKVTPSSKAKQASGKGLEFKPWQSFQKYRQGGSRNDFEHVVMESLANDQDAKEWEKAIDALLNQMFQDKKSPSSMEELVSDAIFFRKEFSRIKRQFNKVMRSIDISSKRETEKVGEKKSLRPKFIEGYMANIKRWGDPRLFQKNMEEISEEDVLQLQEPIRCMAERLKVRLENLKKLGKGKVDIKKTMRASIATFGEPIRIVFSRPKRKNVRWVILSDISGSVKHATRLFMSFLFELKHVLEDDIHAYAFVDQLQEISDILKEKHYQNMVQRIYSEGEINFRGYSDYGMAFTDFDVIAEDILNSQTILLIIGDARNNRRNPRLDLLQKWSQRTKKVLWFNPELPEKWDEGDSIIGIYHKAIYQLYDVSTPEKLVMAIENVII